MTISTKEQSSLNNLEEEHYNIADFIIVTDEDIPDTYKSAIMQ
jgi:hypothetical protein